MGEKPMKELEMLVPIDLDALAASLAGTPELDSEDIVDFVVRIDDHAGRWDFTIKLYLAVEALIKTREAPEWDFIRSLAALNRLDEEGDQARKALGSYSDLIAQATELLAERHKD